MTYHDLEQGNNCGFRFIVISLLVLHLSYSTYAEVTINLPEIIATDSPKRNMVHLIAHVREYSSLTTYTDTVFLFREKIVDFMLPRNKKCKFKGWSNPRLITSKSYYKFTNNNGLDSVSDTYYQHFSWSDWIGLPSKGNIPLLSDTFECWSDTLQGRYGPIEIWHKSQDRLTLEINVTADTIARRWVPALKGFFRRGMDFDKLSLYYEYEDIVANPFSPIDVTRYSYQIDSAAGDRVISPSGRRKDPCYISTDAEVVILDRRFITSKEAKKWEQRKYATSTIEEYDYLEFPELPSAMHSLVERVKNIDKTQQRLSIKPNKRYIGKLNVSKKESFGKRLLNLILH